MLPQDAGLLYYQSRSLRAKGYNFARAPAAEPEGAAAAERVAYDKLAFTPTPSDKGVVSFRGWLRRHGGDGIPWACDDVLPPLGSEDIFDMWDAHTKHCSQCQGALRQLRALRSASLALLLASVIWAPDGAGRTAAILAAAAAAAATNAVIGLFYRYEYSHSSSGPLDWYLAGLDRIGKK